jgi:transcriptional regulator with XRE-family HTH domain
MTQARTLGAVIAKMRRDRELSMERLAKRSGVSFDTLRRIERGTRYSPTVRTVEKLCEGLGVPVSAVFEAAETGVRSDWRELLELLLSRRPRDIALVLRVVRALLEGLDAVVGESVV